MSRLVTREILESGGHTPTFVGDGEEALDALESDNFDLALFDLSMPKVSGIQALRMYRFTNVKAIPVLIMSANATPDVVAECKAAGCAELIPKPLEASTLLDAIEHHLACSARAAVPISARADGEAALVLIEVPVLDSRTIADLDGLSSNPLFLERLVIGFRNDTDRILVAIRYAMNQELIEEVKNSAHRLEDVASSIGAVRLRQLAARLAGANHDTIRQRATHLLNELNQATKQTRLILEKHVEARRGRQAPGDGDL